jgi:hypothetical protein
MMYLTNCELGLMLLFCEIRFFCDGKHVIVAKEVYYAVSYYVFDTVHVIGRFVICRLMSFV